MKPLNKKIINATILIFVLVLLSTLVYAKAFTDSFAGGLKQINDFFAQEQYKPFAKAIDFFIFSLFFIAIYMMGVRYAFKEVKRAEQVIAILLGLTTAFLLVLRDISITFLLPYIHWLLYLLLFLFYWWLLKGIKSKFWRFVLALLLTLLTIALVQGLFAALAPEAKAPEITFFKDFADLFKGIQLPEVPGIPEHLKELVSVPTPVPTGPETLPAAKPEEAPGRGGIFGTGIPWWIIPLLFLLGLGVRGAYKKGWFKRKPENKIISRIDKVIGEKTNAIDKVIGEKTNAINQINQIQANKTNLIRDTTQRADIINDIINRYPDPAYFWEHLEQFRDLTNPLKKLQIAEKELVNSFKNLKKIEVDLYHLLDQWAQVLNASGINISQEKTYFVDLISKKTSISQIGDMGIIWLIVICYDFEQRQIILRNDISQMLGEENVENIIRTFTKAKFERIKNAAGEEERRLIRYNEIENRVLRFLNQKIQLQITKLQELKRRIIQRLPPPQVPQPTPTLPAGITVEIAQPAATTPPTRYAQGAPIQLEAQVFDQQHNTFDLSQLPNVVFIWVLKQDLTQHWLHTGRTGTPNAPVLLFDRRRPIELKVILKDTTTNRVIAESAPRNIFIVPNIEVRIIHPAPDSEHPPGTPIQLEAQTFDLQNNTVDLSQLPNIVFNWALRQPEMDQQGNVISYTFHRLPTGRTGTPNAPDFFDPTRAVELWVNLKDTSINQVITEATINIFIRQPGAAPPGQPPPRRRPRRAGARQPQRRQPPRQTQRRQPQARAQRPTARPTARITPQRLEQIAFTLLTAIQKTGPRHPYTNLTNLGVVFKRNFPTVDIRPITPRGMRGNTWLLIFIGYGQNLVLVPSIPSVIGANWKDIKNYVLKYFEVKNYKGEKPPEISDIKKLPIFAYDAKTKKTSLISKGLIIKRVPYRLTLIPQNSAPKTPIQIYSTYHNNPQNSLKIGKGANVQIILENTRINAIQAAMQFYEPEYKFIIIQGRIQNNIVIKNRTRVATDDRLDSGNTININGYKFNLEIKPVKAVPKEDAYIKQFTIRLVLVNP